MFCFSRCCRFFLLACIVMTHPIAARAELTSDEIKAGRKITDRLKRGAQQYLDQRYEQSGELLLEAMAELAAIAPGASAEFRQAIAPSLARMGRLHTRLEFEGLLLPPLRQPNWEGDPRTAAPSSTEGITMISDPSSAAIAGKLGPQFSDPDTSDASMLDTAMSDSEPGEPRPDSPSKPTSPATPTPAVSFTETVAPILSNRCGRCHISQSRGQFDMSSFAALMKGPPEGVVVFPGDVVASRLIETIETGDMPRGGGRVTPQELATLKQWVLAGATYDGADPMAPIDASAPTPNTRMAVEVKQPTGSETVSFAADVAPLLVDNCSGCHLDAMQTRGGLRMDTFAQFLRGGDSGAIIEPGNAGNSLLIGKLRGTADGQRMPAGGRPALEAQAIELIATWINEGAAFDGSNESQPLRVMSQLAWAASASPQELSERRAELAEQHTDLVTASAGTIHTATTPHFQVFGSASQGTIDLVADVAEQQLKLARTVVRAASGDEFFHGKATIFVWPKRYDYSEFTRMVEQIGVPVDWQSHWRFDGIDAYVSLIAGEQDEKEQLEARLAGPLVSLAVATRGNVPRWFAEGVGTTTANRQGGSRDRERRREREAAIAAAVAAAPSAKAFLDNKLPPEQTDHIGTAIAATAMDRTRRRNFDTLIRNLDSGQGFEEAFLQAYRVTPETFVEAWFDWVGAGDKQR